MVIASQGIILKIILGIALLAFFGWLVMYVYRWVDDWTSSFLTKDDKMSDDEIKKILSEEFSKSYKLFFLITTLFVLVGCLLLVGFGLMYVQSKAVNWDNVLLVIPHQTSYMVFFISGLLLSIPAFAFFITYVSDKYPKFRRFMIRENIRGNLRYRFNFTRDLVISLRLLLRILIITTPIVYFALFNYTYITQDGIYFNKKFFSLKKEFIAWENVNKVKTEANVEYRFKVLNSNLNLMYIVRFKNEEINLFRAMNTDKKVLQIIHVNEIITFKNIPLESEKPDKEAVEEIKKQFSGSELYDLAKILKL